MPELRDESAHVSVSGFDSKLVQEVRPTITRNFEPKSDLRLDSFSDSLLPKISFRWKPEHEQTKMHQMYLYIFTYLLTSAWCRFNLFRYLFLLPLPSPVSPLAPPHRIPAKPPFKLRPICLPVDVVSLLL